MARRAQAVDPAVSRTKFDRELSLFRDLGDVQRERGWWLLEAPFPEVLIAFAAPQLQPPAIVFGALLDFTDYDFYPPSVRLVNPFTREPYMLKTIPTVMRRRSSAPAIIQNMAPGLGILAIQEQPLMQARAPDDIPFLCIPGVREYHDHPGHSGDAWQLHRGSGEGTLNHILDVLYRYGVQPIREYQLGLRVTGFGQSESPE